MSRPAPDLTDIASRPGQVIYEQPLTERVRTLLRLEFLFRQLAHHAAGHSRWESRAAVATMLDVLAILTRGDVRKDVLKELEVHTGLLQRYQATPGVDGARLDAVIDEVQSVRERLAGPCGQLAQRLKDSEFLNSVKHRSAIPGGTCEFDLPDYNHWLNRPYQSRAEDFADWLDGLEPLRKAVNKLLWLTRERAQPTPEVASGGMFTHSLERGLPCQLLRVGLEPDTPYFPEISGSPHRFIVRFRTWQDVASRPVQTTDDVEFILTCC